MLSATRNGGRASIWRGPRDEDRSWHQCNDWRRQKYDDCAGDGGGRRELSSAPSRPRRAAGRVTAMRGREYAADSPGSLKVHPLCELEVLFELRPR